MQNLSFVIENLGVIKEGRFTQKPLTLFCGPNNSGKTWAMYSLYYSHYLMSIDGVIKPENSALSDFNGNLKRGLPDLFNTRASVLEKAVFKISDWHRKDFPFLSTYKRDKINFLMPAERNGLHLFYRELSTKRTALLHHASKENIDLHELLRDVIRSRYAAPIAHYIDWLNQLADIQRATSGHFHPFAERIKKRLVGGAYQVNRRTGDIRFKPYQIKRDGKATKMMGLHMASSAVKSLFGLWFYLENQARPGDVLMIDEPELNIHPKNQLEMARLLARLVNAGLNVVISTHSDYMVREFNNLLMLSEDGSACLKKRYQYDDEEVLRPDQIGAYLFDDQTITPFTVTAEDGVYATTFDDVIRRLNQVNDGIYYALQEQRMEREDD